MDGARFTFGATKKTLLHLVDVDADDADAMRGKNDDEDDNNYRTTATRYNTSPPCPPERHRKT